MVGIKTSQLPGANEVQRKHPGHTSTILEIHCVLQLKVSVELIRGTSKRRK